MLISLKDILNFIGKIVSYLLVIAITIAVVRKTTPVRPVRPEIVTVVDTLYLTDTLKITKTLPPDTIYIGTTFVKMDTIYEYFGRYSCALSMDKQGRRVHLKSIEGTNPDSLRLKLYSWILDNIDDDFKIRLSSEGFKLQKHSRFRVYKWRPHIGVYLATDEVAPLISASKKQYYIGLRWDILRKQPKVFLIWQTQ